MHRFPCHQHLDTHPKEKKAWFVENFGLRMWDELTLRSNKTADFKDWEILMLIEKYEQKIKELESKV
jgi:hypothetical protein